MISKYLIISNNSSGSIGGSGGGISISSCSVSGSKYKFSMFYYIELWDIFTTGFLGPSSAPISTPVAAPVTGNPSRPPTKQPVLILS